MIPAAPSATAKTTAVPPVGDKTRPVRLTEKTGVVPNLGSKRSFFGTTGSERVYSKEPPEIIEKPATIKSRSKFDKTSDLQEIPTILAVEELEHTRIWAKIRLRPGKRSRRRKRWRRAPKFAWRALTTDRECAQY